jgi:hypothetical protein
VNVRRIVPTIMDETYDYTMTEDRSSVIPFTGSSLSFTFSGPVGAEWVVDSIAKSRRDMGVILTILDSGITELDEIALFGVTPTEPLLTFKNLWKQHEEYAYRFGALMLAVVWLMNEQQAA